MNRRRRLQVVGLVGLLIAVVLLIPWLARGPTGGPGSRGPRGAQGLPYRPVVIGFYEDAGRSTPGSFPALKRHHRLIHVVAPYWYQVDSAGMLRRVGPQPAVVRFARERGVRVMPMVTNLGTGMLDVDVRPRVVQELGALVRRHDYDGLFLDFELLPPYRRGDFTGLVVEMGHLLHGMGKKLGVAVMPKVGVPASVSAAYDYRTIGHVADYVVLMAYDLHENTSPPGPIAPQGWVLRNVQYALRYIPRDHLVLGVGQYGYNWTAPGQGQDITTTQAVNLARRENVPVHWSPTHEEAYFTYTDRYGRTHTVWFEDTRSFTAKYRVVSRYRLRGIALWRLNFERTSFWRALQLRLEGAQRRLLPRGA